MRMILLEKYMYAWTIEAGYILNETSQSWWSIACEIPKRISSQVLTVMYGLPTVSAEVWKEVGGCHFILMSLLLLSPAHLHTCEMLPTWSRVIANVLFFSYLSGFYYSFCNDSSKCRRVFLCLLLWWLAKHLPWWCLLCHVDGERGFGKRNMPSNSSSPFHDSIVYCGKLHLSIW